MIWWDIFRPWRRKATADSAARSRRKGQRQVAGRWTWPVWLPPAFSLLLLLVVHSVVFPVAPRVHSDFPMEGQIAEKEIRAPFDFQAPLPELDIEMRQLQRVLVEPPVLKRLVAVDESMRLRMESFGRIQTELAGLTALNEADRSEILALRYPDWDDSDLRRLAALSDPAPLLGAASDAIKAITEQGVVDNLPPGNYHTVRILFASAESTVEAQNIVRQEQIGTWLTAELAGSGLAPDMVAWASRLLRPMVSPNLVYDANLTQVKRLAARQSVPIVNDILRGERIVDRGERVTSVHTLALSTLESMLVAQSGPETGGEVVVQTLARIALLGAMILLFGWVLRNGMPTILSDLRHLASLTLILVLYLVGSATALDQPSLGLFAIPVVWLAVLVTTLFREKAGYPAVVLAVSLIAFSGEMTALGMTSLLILGLAAVTLVRRIRQRDQFYQAIAVLAGLGLLMVALLDLSTGTIDTRIWNEFLVAMLTPIASVALALFLLPIVEPLVGVSSDLTLLELSDLNHPLLKRMALECQGTFHHSQVAGQLSEHAARAIGANSLLTRVGALFHDIGKMTKPEYFVENQGGGRNRHDELSPSMSALVVGAHVKNGIEMGQQWRLPQAVIDFIPEHHGTNVMKYFYHKALEDNSNETVKVDDFRYPGPKPQSRETAILMLADAVEAATRSLAKPTPGRIREMVKQIVDERMLSGELDECGLTLKNLSVIRESFIPLLTSIHHSRIAYPGQKEHTSASGGDGGL